MRQTLDEKRENVSGVLSSILDNHTWRHLEKTSCLSLIYGVFSIRIAKFTQSEGVKMWLHLIFNTCYI